MENGGLKKLNIAIVIASIILPIVFIAGTIVEQLYVYGNSYAGIGFLLLWFLLTTVGYWVGLITGLRSIATGKPKTMSLSAGFHLLMYIPHLASACIMAYQGRNSSLTGMQKFIVICAVVLGVMILLNIVRIIAAKNASYTEGASTGSKKLAINIFLFGILIPFGFITLVFFAAKYFQEHPEVGRIAGFIIAGVVILAIFIAFAVLSKHRPVSGGSSGRNYGSASSSSRNGDDERRAREEAARKADKEEQKIIKDLNDRYYEAYKRITKESPALLDYKIIKEGPMKEAVKALRKRMQDEARQKGVYGKTKWF